MLDCLSHSQGQARGCKNNVGYCYILEFISGCETQQWGTSQDLGGPPKLPGPSLWDTPAPVPPWDGAEPWFEVGQELSFPHSPLFSWQQ